MLPSAIAIIDNMEQQLGESEATNKYGIALVLCCAYMSSMGGGTTIVGTPPNLILVDVINKFFPEIKMSFFDYMKICAPICMLVALMIFAYFSWAVVPHGSKLREVRMSSATEASYEHRTAMRLGNIAEYEDLGPMCQGEKVTAALFVGGLLLWMFRLDIGLQYFVIPGCT